MRGVLRILLVGLMLASTLDRVQAADEELASDRPAALLNYPLIVVNDGVVDTVVQLTNTSTEPVNVTCFYEDTNGHCTNTGSVCYLQQECCGLGPCGLCRPGWAEMGFHLRLTPRQPIGWWASRGLDEFPIDGVDRKGIDGSDNRGSLVPTIAEKPFIGMLKCLAVDAEGNPTEVNALEGEATIQTRIPGLLLDVAKYNAIGFPAVEGSGNGDTTLLLGGFAAEYAGCPSVLLVNHFFDLATNPISGLPIQTTLVLSACTTDLLQQFPGSAVVQYLVFNEFEQRFSTSRGMAAQQALPLAFIDTLQPTRSIFSAGIAGTLTGQTRVKAIGSGLVGIAVEMHGGGCVGGLGCRVFPLSTAAFNLHYQGEREIPDLILLP